MKKTFFVILNICISLLFVSFHVPLIQNGVSYRIQDPVYNFKEQSSYDLTLIIPYMNRKRHRADFLQYMGNYTQIRYPGKRILIIISEQGDNDLPFSRSWTFNAGYTYFKANFNSPCVALHDVDRFPCRETGTVPYFDCKRPNHLSSENPQWKWKVPYKTYIGGVLSMSPYHWEKINGMNNEYRGWGAEDDDIYMRMKHSRILPFVRPEKGFGRFCDFPRKSKDHSFDKTKALYKRNIELLKKATSSSTSYMHNGLSSFSGSLVAVRHDNFTWPNMTIIQVTHTVK